MRRLAFGFIGTTCGYILGAVAGYAVISKTSSNMHDRQVEAATTAAFLTGPLGAIFGGIAGWLVARRGRSE